jgi:DNA adenine methylase
MHSTKHFELPPSRLMHGITMSRLQPFRPVLRWPGGKSRMLRYLLPLIPKHVCYCEPFAGGLALLLAKPRSDVEIINDLNGDLVALYRSIQYHLPELLRELSFLISSREILAGFIRQPGLTDIQRAARFYYRNRTSFAGTMRSFAVAKTKGGGAGFPQDLNRDLLGQARERLDRVVIENVSYERCLSLYDSPETFFFIDPPYLNSKADAYAGWTEAQIRDLAARVAGLAGQWVVTLDDSAFNREVFKGYKIDSVESRNGTANVRKVASRMCEIIVRKETV